MSVFIDGIIEKAKTLQKTIILPESLDPRVVEAASRAVSEKLAKIILVGEKEATEKACPGIDLTGIEFIHPEAHPQFEEFVAEYHKMREKKGMTAEKAREVMKEAPSFGMMLLKHDLADGLVSGAVHSTSDTLRPALQIVRTKPGTKLVSAFFMMIVPDCPYGANGTFLFADSGLNENPDAEMISEIALSSAESFRYLADAEPVVAMCSYSSYGSAKSELTEKMIQATAAAKEKAPDLKLDGELQIDAALVPAISAKKAPGNQVMGKANVLVFPDLNVGNIAYKLVQYLAKAEAYGPLLQGIAKAVNDLSRGCSADDIVGVIAITALQAELIAKQSKESKEG